MDYFRKTSRSLAFFQQSACHSPNGTRCTRMQRYFSTALHVVHRRQGILVSNGCDGFRSVNLLFQKPDTKVSQCRHPMERIQTRSRQGVRGGSVGMLECWFCWGLVTKRCPNNVLFVIGNKEKLIIRNMPGGRSSGTGRDVSASKERKTLSGIQASSIEIRGRQSRQTRVQHVCICIV